MDRSWMRNPNRVSTQYEEGIKDFIENAKNHLDQQNKIKCPCMQCSNLKMWELEAVHKHLFRYGIEPFYDPWIHHGEGPDCNETHSNTVRQSDDCDHDEALNMVNDVFPYASGVSGNQNMDYDDDFDNVEGCRSTFCTVEDYKKYERLLNETQQELYPGCDEFSILSVVVELMHMKVTYLVSNKCFDIMLDIMRRMLQRNYRLPQTHYHCMKILKDLGLGHDKIDICPNDCSLFDKENKGKEKCPVCGESRYKNQKSNVQDDNAAKMQF